ncbi:hypothetical protein IFM89_037499 [Coptis chinensis]|uniref:DUF8039 domain-containing protein n=1 Tax=Coptis chinensis TaxID=261450 RepID=A0A835H363_9MAGN|nr:hypothetical protein IFM89_037499 [Coptis chinensis]
MGLVTICTKTFMGTPSQNNLNLSESDFEDDMERTNYDRTPSTPESSNAPKETRGKAKGMSNTPNTKKKVWLTLDHLEQPCHPLAEERINEDMSANSRVSNDNHRRCRGQGGRCRAMGPGVNKTAMKSMEPVLDQNYHLAEENSKLWKETQTNQMNFAMQLEEIRSTMLRQQEPSTTNSFGTSSNIPRSSNATSPLDIVATGCVKEVDPTYKFHKRCLGERSYLVYVDEVHAQDAALPCPHDAWCKNLGESCPRNVIWPKSCVEFLSSTSRS